MKLSGIDDLLSKLDRNPTIECQEVIHDALETLTKPEDIMTFYDALMARREREYCMYKDPEFPNIGRTMAHIEQSEELGNILATYECITEDHETIHLWKKTIPNFIVLEILYKNKKK